MRAERAGAPEQVVRHGQRDDDGAVVVPISLAEQLLERASHHAEWEDFSRMRLLEGGDLRKYYPLSEEGRVEYIAWREAQGIKGPVVIE